MAYAFSIESIEQEIMLTTLAVIRRSCIEGSCF